MKKEIFKHDAVMALIGDSHWTMIDDRVIYLDGATITPSEDEILSKWDEMKAQLIVDEAKAIVDHRKKTDIANIKVTYNGVVYQGNEISQERMSRNILALTDDITTINWLSENNTFNALTRVDLTFILADACLQQSNVLLLHINK